MFPLVAIATSLVPDLINLIAGDKGGTLATDVANTVEQIAGTSDPAAAKQKIESDRTAAADLQIHLAQIALSAAKAQYDAQNRQRQDTFDDLKQRLADVQSARTNLLDLASNQSAVAWVAPIISLLVMIGFYVLLFILIRYYGTNNVVSQNQLINICIGALVAAFSTVVNFWLGSSKSSQDKDRAQAAQTADVLSSQAQQTKTALNTANVATEKAAAATTAPTVSIAARDTAQPNTAGTLQTDETTNFNQCLTIVLAEEGGYNNDPADRGGPTNFGITLEDLKEWRGKAITADDVKTLTKKEAQEIYRSKYWNPMQCSALPNGVDLEVFDFGINAGLRTAIKALQEIIGVTSDGSIGPITLSAAKAADARTVILTLSERRLDYYHGLADWPTLGIRWTNRTNTIERAALKMAGTTGQTRAPVM